MIPGSHNPPEFNGFKICRGPETLYGEEIQKLRALAGHGPLAQGNGTLEQVDVLPAYVDALRSCFHPARHLKIVLDAGNGTAGLVAPGQTGGGPSSGRGPGLRDPLAGGKPGGLLAPLVVTSTFLA